jgi:hypothetical protein
MSAEVSVDDKTSKLSNCLKLLLAFFTKLYAELLDLPCPAVLVQILGLKECNQYLKSNLLFLRRNLHIYDFPFSPFQ